MIIENEVEARMILLNHLYHRTKNKGEFLQRAETDTTILQKEASIAWDLIDYFADNGYMIHDTGVTP